MKFASKIALFLFTTVLATSASFAGPTEGIRHHGEYPAQRGPYASPESRERELAEGRARALAQCEQSHGKGSESCQRQNCNGLSRREKQACIDRLKKPEAAFDRATAPECDKTRTLLSLCPKGSVAFGSRTPDAPVAGPAARANEIAQDKTVRAQAQTSQSDRCTPRPGMAVVMSARAKREWQQECGTTPWQQAATPSPVQLPSSVQAPSLPSVLDSLMKR